MRCVNKELNYTQWSQQRIVCKLARLAYLFNHFTVVYLRLSGMRR